MSNPGENIPSMSTLKQTRSNTRAVRVIGENWCVACKLRSLIYQLIIGDHTEPATTLCGGMHWVANQIQPTSSYHKTGATRAQASKTTNV